MLRAKQKTLHFYFSNTTCEVNKLYVRAEACSWYRRSLFSATDYVDDGSAH